MKKKIKKLRKIIIVGSVFATTLSGVVTPTIISAIQVEAAVKTGWSDKGNYYYKNGIAVKGLQKIDGKWYLFDKKTGEYKNQSGKNIYLGSFFSSNANITQQFFFTLDGVNFNKITTGDYKGRDMSWIYKDGSFYGVQTKGTGRDYFFKIVRSDNLNTFSASFARTQTIDKEYKSNNNTDLLWEFHKHGQIWAPEFMVNYTNQTVEKIENLDTKNSLNEYVYYGTKDEKGNSVIYRARIKSTKDNVTYIDIGTKNNVKICTFDDKPEDYNCKNRIDPAVIKVGEHGKPNAYIMTLKLDVGEEKTAIYTSKDGLNWEFNQVLDFFRGKTLNSPIFTAIGDKILYNGEKYNSITMYNGKKYKNINTIKANVGYEGPTLAYINGTYYLYADHYVYTKEKGNNAYPDTTNNTGMSYDGKIHYAKSNSLKDLLNGKWDYYFSYVIKTGELTCRHGSVTLINNDTALKKIQKLYNQ